MEVSYLEDLSGAVGSGLLDSMQGLAALLLLFHDGRLLVELEEAELETAATVWLEARSHDKDAEFLSGSNSDEGSNFDSDDALGDNHSPPDGPGIGQR